MIDDALGIAGRAGRVIDRDRGPFVPRPARARPRRRLLERLFIVEQPGRASGWPVACDKDVGVADALAQRRLRKRQQFLLDNHDMTFAVFENGGDRRSIKPRVERVQRPSRKGNAVMRLQQERRVGRQDRDDVAIAYPEIVEKPGQPAYPVGKGRVREPALAVDDRDLSAIGSLAAPQERDRRQRNEVRGVAFEP